MSLDPLAPMRAWVAQWEKFVNEQGGQLLQRPETARAMQALSGAMVKAQAASNEATSKMLAAANLPSRADVEALGARLAQIEAMLARLLGELESGGSGQRRPAVPRTRKPPQQPGE